MNMYEEHKATLRFRRGEGWNVKPELEAWDGKEITVRYGFKLDKEDTSLYVGEIAYVVMDEDWPSGWVASGDLEIEYAEVEPYDIGSLRPLYITERGVIK